MGRKKEIYRDVQFFHGALHFTLRYITITNLLLVSV